ncbi:MAG: hypothetical protein WDO17_24360 [Alphaproteobacteria bacterium]
MRHGDQQAGAKKPAGAGHAVDRLFLAFIEHPRDADRRMRQHGAVIAGRCGGWCERNNDAGKRQAGAQMKLARRVTSSVH